MVALAKEQPQVEEDDEEDADPFAAGRDGRLADVTRRLQGR